MQLIKCNFTEIGILSGVSKDTARIAIERLLKDLSAKIRGSGRVEMALPGVGCLNVYDGIAAVAFDDALIGHTINATNKNLHPVDRKIQAQNYMTSDTIDKFQLAEQGYDVQNYQGRYMALEPEARDYIERGLNITLNPTRLSDSYRPLTASVNYDNLSVSYNKTKRLMSSRPLQRDLFTSNGNRSNSSAIGNRPGTAGPSRTTDNRSSIHHPLSIRYQNMIQPTSQKIADTRIKSIVKKRLGLWIREQSMPPIDAFFKIISKELGDNVTRSTRVDRDLFSRCLLLLDIGIDEKSAQKYCGDIADRDGKIDAQTFISSMLDEDRDDLNHIRDIIYLNGLNFEDILKTMDIPKENAELDMFKISKGICRLDIKMPRAKADQLAVKILGERETISTYDLIESLEGINRGEARSDLESNLTVLRKIRIKLLDSKQPELLLEEFEKLDEKNDGLLDSANFKTCLLKLKKQLDLTIGEINRIARYEPKDKNGLIDYNKFLERLDKEIINMTLKDANALNEDSLFSLKELRHQIKDYLSRYRLSPLQFLANLSSNGNKSGQFTDQELKMQRLAVPIEQFKQFLLNNVIKIKDVRPETLNFYIHKIDIDRDGIIDSQDFEAFMTRHKLLEDTSLRLANTIKDVTGEDYDDKILKNHNKEHFYPVAPLAKSRIDLVLRSLRTAIGSRNLSFREFFTKLDENKDGLISFDEFKAGIKNIVKFSDPTIKGLFAYMDRNQIGLVDFNNFLKVMKKSVLDNLEEKTEDNFDWQVETIKQIQQWYFNSGIPSEDAFRIMDVDYDQYISKKDLQIFLQTVLFIPVEEVTSLRIDRLFNLLDQYKRGRVGYEDFRRVLTESFQPTDNISLTGGVPINKHSFDWKLNARQKMGLFISRKYKTLDQSFDEISMQGPRITFEQFSKWITTQSVLDGFNLTEKLVKDLFSDFDPHKKGHLTRSDWQAVFAPYDNYTIKINEIIDMISINFSTSKDAFDYFASFGPSKQIVYQPGFEEALESLFPKRFVPKDKEMIWRMISDAGALNRNSFSRLMNNAEFSGNVSMGAGRVRPQTATPVSFTTKTIAIEPDTSDIISVLRDYLKSCHKSLEEVFAEIDITKSGRVTNLEFKEAIRKLQTGLSSKDIDDLLNATPLLKDGRIDYNDFIKKMKETPTEWRIQDRTRQRLHSIKDLIYVYMLSPKDAFRQFNSDRTGKLTFVDFQQMMRQLYNYTGDSVPTFSVLRDLFNYFDKRKDGFIDQREWLETFRRIEVPIKSEHLKHIVLNPNGAAYSNYELSDDFDRVIRAINKNRKYIIDKLSSMEASGTKIDFKTLKGFLTGFLRSQRIDVDTKLWKLLIGFAERDQERVDYRYLLDRYRERTSKVNTYPNLNKSQSTKVF